VQLTKDREPELLARHALPSLMILDRIAGLFEEAIGRAPDAGDREVLLTAAARAAGPAAER
jgi:hypothetical protein